MDLFLGRIPNRVIFLRYVPCFEQGIVTAPVLFALKEFPEMSKLIQRKFKTVTDINQVFVFPSLLLRTSIESFDVISYRPYQCFQTSY